MRIAFRFFLLLVFTFPAYSQNIQSMDFHDQDITDILLVLAKMSGSSIIPDETVTGRASYFFSETDIDTALKLFLSTYKLYLRKENKVYYVSRIKTFFDSETGNVDMDAEDVPIHLLVKALSRAIAKTILFDPLPRETITIHTAETNPEKVLEVLMTRFTDYTITSDPQYFYVKRNMEQTASLSNTIGKGNYISVKNNLYSTNVVKGRFKEVLGDLFEKGNYEYSFLSQGDSMLENLHFTDKSFEEILRLIAEQGNSDFKKVGDIYYIFDVQRRDILNKYITNVRVPLHYIPVSEFSKLIPPALASGNIYRIEAADNSVILSGSVETITPIKKFISEIDKPIVGKEYQRFDLNYINVEDFLQVLPPYLKIAQPVTLKNTNSFIMLLAPEKIEEMKDFIAQVDRKSQGTPIKLRYIKSEDLMKSLPPSVNKEEIKATSDPLTIFCTGSDEKRKEFIRELDAIDQPVPQIRYELFVIQYQNSKSFNWETDFSNSVQPDGAKNSFLGALGNLLSLNFDIVSTFGYMFAFKLNTSISDSNARILADTTLNGLSGEKISFQNTNTYRYRDTVIDPDTGLPKDTGITREITSGLLIDIDGWVSGDGMITMSVSSTVSRRGADSGASSTTLPSTSEKVVNTHVRTKAGEPVVISGLIQQEQSESDKKVPLVWNIPLVGNLFRTVNKSNENTEMVIYILPHIDYPEDFSEDKDWQIERLYNKFVRE